MLPLSDFSGDAHRPSFADTVSEALTTDLAGTQGLRVTSRRSAEAFEGSKKTRSEIGRELKVDALLEGGVGYTHGRIHMELRMFRTAGGQQIWSARFDRLGRDIFALENDAVRAVRTALALAPNGEDRVRTPPTGNLEAFDLYLRGKIHLLRENERENLEAIRLFESAIAADPSFAAAQAELSLAYGIRVAQFAPGDGTALERAEAAAQAALRLAPDLAEAHAATAFLLWGAHPDRFWHERAAQELNRAIALNPNSADAHHMLGMIYLHVGLFDRAIAELQKTLLIDPIASNARRRIALIHAYRGEYDEAREIIREVPERDGTSLWGYGNQWILQHLGRHREALSLAEERLQTHPEDRGGVVTSSRAVLFAEAGDVRRATGDIRAAIEKGKGFVHFHHATYNIASAYALLGKTSEALHWLRWTAENGFPCYPLFAADPNLTRIRQDRAYISFMADLKDQWERYRANL
jgi:adenylate cyclase